eukprot:jgi/Mesen1/7481/ME000039S06700
MRAPHSAEVQADAGSRGKPLLGYRTPDFRSLFLEGLEIGRGLSGVVKTCVLRGTPQTFACKSLSKSQLKSAPEGTLDNFLHEIKLMKRLKGHPNVVELHGVYEDEESLYLVMELCEGGELYREVIRRKHYQEADAAVVFSDIASAVAHCHAAGVMHGDLKPENLLLSSRVAGTGPHPRVKLADFGLSLLLAAKEKVRGRAGSPYYMAPEVLDRSYDRRSDLWALGVILFILLSGIPPFCGESDKEIFAAIRKGRPNFKRQIWRSVSSEAKDLIWQLLSEEPSKRPPAASLLAHPWVVKYTGGPLSLREREQSRAERGGMQGGAAHNPALRATALSLPVSSPLLGTGIMSGLSNSRIRQEGEPFSRAISISDSDREALLRNERRGGSSRGVETAAEEKVERRLAGAASEAAAASNAWSPGAAVAPSGREGAGAHSQDIAQAAVLVAGTAATDAPVEWRSCWDPGAGATPSTGDGSSVGKELSGERHSHLRGAGAGTGRGVGGGGGPDLQGTGGKGLPEQQGARWLAGMSRAHVESLKREIDAKRQAARVKVVALSPPPSYLAGHHYHPARRLKGGRASGGAGEGGLVSDDENIRRRNRNLELQIMAGEAVAEEEGAGGGDTPGADGGSERGGSVFFSRRLTRPGHSRTASQPIWGLTVPSEASPSLMSPSSSEEQFRIDPDEGQAAWRGSREPVAGPRPGSSAGAPGGGKGGGAAVAGVVVTSLLPVAHLPGPLPEHAPIHALAVDEDKPKPPASPPASESGSGSGASFQASELLGSAGEQSVPSASGMRQTSPPYVPPVYVAGTRSCPDLPRLISTRSLQLGEHARLFSASPTGSSSQGKDLPRAGAGFAAFPLSKDVVPEVAADGTTGGPESRVGGGVPPEEPSKLHQQQQQYQPGAELASLTKGSPRGMVQGTIQLALPSWAWGNASAAGFCPLPVITHGRSASILSQVGIGY